MKIRFFLFSALLMFFLSSGKQRPVHVFMAGDSTMAEKPLTKTVTDTVTGEKFTEIFYERGWGMLLPEFLKKNSEVINLAQNGRSTRTFIEQGWWDKIYNQVQPGDIVIIQFGHNDGAIDKPDRYTTPEDYRKNLKRFIEETRSKGGFPILCTSIARRKFDSNGKIVDVHGVYPVITRELGAELNVPVIDMYKSTTNWLEKNGIANSAGFFHKVANNGKSKLYPKGLDDNTHLNEAGARIVTSMFVNEVKHKKIKELTALIK